MKQPLRNFGRRVLHWYDLHKRDLPWRGIDDPYAVWVSEIMLQQTTVNAVIPYFKRWLEHFPSVQTLARAPLQKVLKAWQGLGYYQRARNLHAAAKIIVRKYGGRLPSEEEFLRALPGFGDYTTAAILSIVFGRSAALVDANVRRVLMRVFGMAGKAEPRIDKMILVRLTSLIPKKRPGDFNQALMELGALVCRPKNPQCLMCPLRDDCAAFAAGQQEVIPSVEARRYRRITAVVGIIRKNGRILIQRRPEAGLLGGLWEFPGGKVRPGETLTAALARELKEELGVRPAEPHRLMTVDHSYSNFLVTLHAYECRLKSDPALDPQSQKWARPVDLRKYPFPSGSAKIVERILEKRQSARD